MKKIFLFLTLSFFLIITSAAIIQATSPLPTPAASRTSFSGIIPLVDNSLEVISFKYEVDFLNSDLVVQKNIERSAQVKLHYEINNPDDVQNVKFVLPFLSRFPYIQNEISVKVNNNQIDTNLDFGFFNVEYLGDTITNYFEDFNKDEYLNSPAKNYEFENDIDGFLYTLTNPKTKSDKYKAGTDIVFYDVPSDAIFIDGNTVSLTKSNSRVVSGSKIYDSEEIAYFFVSKDIETDCITTEWEDQGNVFSSNGELIEPATITKEPIKLSDYIKRFYLEKYDYPYKDAYEKCIYNITDNRLTDEYTMNWIGLYFDIQYYMENTYHLFGIEFDAKFAANSKTTLEITYEIPVFCKYANRYKESEMILDFISNPGKLWQVDSETEVKVITDERLKEATIEYQKEGYEYSFSIKDRTEFVVFTNSKYRGCGSKGGCSSLIFGNTIYFGLILITIIFVRRKRIS